jgi:hypothetical protein
MSTVKTNNILDASGGNTATINSMTPTADSLQGFRNRIINGDMRIDQRNAGASVTPTTSTFGYPVDRFFVEVSQNSKLTTQQNAGSVTPPSGFTNYAGITSSSAYSVLTADYFHISQRIEGFNVADLGWGTANAKTVTLSFWVRSSLTGTFGGSLTNGNFNRSYPFTYSISAANTWEQKSVTVAGDTTGTWLTNNGEGLRLYISVGAGATYSGTAGAWAGSGYTSATGATSVVGTNGATLYITGVQLEVGSVATPFERRPYTTELQLCQRYYELINEGRLLWAGTTVSGTTYARAPTDYAVVKRAIPTVTTTNTDRFGFGTGAGTVDKSSVSGFYVYLISNATTNDAYVFWSATASAEL